METQEPYEVIEGADVPELPPQMTEEGEEDLYINPRPIFRVLRRLEYSGSPTGFLEKGTLSRLPKCGYVVIDKLKARGIIAEAAVPPLEELPGFGSRAKRLQKLGIETLAHLLGVEDPDVAANKLGIKEETFIKWQDDGKKWLVASTPKKYRG